MAKVVLPRPGRTVEEDVPQRLAPLGGRVDGDLQPRVDLPLADHFPHPLRAEIAIFIVGRFGRSGEDRLAGHAYCLLNW